MSFLDKLLGRSKDTAEKDVDAAEEVDEKAKDVAVTGEEKTATAEGGDGAAGQT
jgi:hypothetical protein